jgi:hypothetical protein
MKAQAFSILVILSSILMMTSCSSSSDALKVGTPAFYWSGAKETYAAGDYVKTVEHLENLARTENEFKARAMPWELILTSGMAKGYMELADNFEFGAKANRGNAAAFRRQMITFRTYANTLALQFAHTYQEFAKTNKDPEITLDFTFPTGSAISSPQLTKIGSGELLSPSIVDDIRRAHLMTTVLLQACRAVGAPDDVAKAQEVFKTTPAKIPRDAFFFAMANALHDQAGLYVRAKLDQPDRVQYFAAQATDTLKQIPESKDTKVLAARIEKTVKAAKTN